MSGKMNDNKLPDMFTGEEMISLPFYLMEAREKELAELRDWKAQRLNEADPKVEALVVLLGKKIEELESWKAKARPFLEKIMQEPMNFTQYKILTELLKDAE